MTIQERAEAYVKKIMDDPKSSYYVSDLIFDAYLAGAESGSPKWVKALEEQIEYSNSQNVKCEKDGDTAGEEAWYGYTKALRWVLDQIKISETHSPYVNDRIEKLEAALRELLRMSQRWGREWFDKETWAKVEAARNLVTPLPEDKK